VLNSTGGIYPCKLASATLFAMAWPLAVSANPEIVLNVGHVTALPGQSVEIPIYLTNQVDTVGAFEFWVQLDRPGIVNFTSIVTQRYDTTWWRCTDVYQQVCDDSVRVPPDAPWDFMHVDTSSISIGTVDASGTLVEDWEFLQARSVGGYGQDLNVVGFSEVHEAVRARGILPQQDGLLVKLLAEVQLIPDNQTNRTVNVNVRSGMHDRFGFSDHSGNPLGLSCDSVPDTSYFYCPWWQGNYCLHWVRVSGPPADSMSIDIVWRCVTDTGTVHALNGSITVLDETTYGDADCNNSADIADLVYFVDFMFRDGPLLPCPKNLECDNDAEITVTDLICLVEWMFPRH